MKKIISLILVFVICSGFTIYLPVVSTGGNNMSLLTNLVSWWTLDNLNDSGPATNTLTNNGMSFVTGKVNNAAYGADYTKALGSTNAIDLRNTSFTIVGWFNVNLVVSNSYVTIFDDEETDMFTSHVSIKAQNIYGSDELLFEMIDRDNQGEGLAIPASLNGVWHFFSVTFDSTSKFSWFRVDSRTPSPHYYYVDTSKLPNKKIIIGSNPSNDPVGNNTKTFDEIALWNRVLTNEEIDTLYNSGNGLTYSSLVQVVTPTPIEATSETYTPADAVTVGTPISLHTRERFYNLNIISQ
jgi:hypothetical protein